MARKNCFFKYISFILILSSLILIFISSALGATVNMKITYDGKTYNYSAEEVKMTVDGAAVTDFDMPPIILNSRTLVPIRAVSEAMNSDVSWNADTKEVYIVRNNEVVVIQIGNTVGSKNGTAFSLDVAPQIINDRTMIPVRAVSEALGCAVDWDANTRTVIIKTENYTAEEPNNPGTPSSSGNEISIQKAYNSGNTFVIEASAAIDKYDVFVVGENRIVVDIYNSVCRISNAKIDDFNNTFVSAIRSSQNQTTPNLITRVVFDLKTESPSYSVSLSSDKKSLILSFGSNEINKINFSSSKFMDTIELVGDVAPAVEISRLSDPERLVVDMPFSTSNLSARPSFSGLKYVEDVRTSQYNDDTARVVIEIDEDAEYFYTQEGNKTIINIFKSTLDNVEYDSRDNAIVLDISGFDEIDDIDVNDDYMNHLYTITLPGDYSDIFGEGVLRVNNEYISEVEVGLDSRNNTYFEIHVNTVLVFEIDADRSNVYFNAKDPKDVYDKIVVIDAGHGGTDPGTNGNGYIEKNINLSIVKYLYELLEDDRDIKVYATRLTDNYPANATRAQIANEVADLFVSVHQNAAEGSATPNGTEVLYAVHENDKAGRLTSKIAAEYILDGLIDTLGTTNRGVKEREDLIVLNSTKVPAVLIETAFLTNPDDAAKVSSSRTQQEIAESIYDSIVYLLDEYRYR